MAVVVVVRVVLEVAEDRAVLEDSREMDIVLVHMDQEVAVDRVALEDQADLEDRADLVELPLVMRGHNLDPMGQVVAPETPMVEDPTDKVRTRPGFPSRSTRKQTRLSSQPTRLLFSFLDGDDTVDM